MTLTQVHHPQNSQNLMATVTCTVALPATVNQRALGRLDQPWSELVLKTYDLKHLHPFKGLFGTSHNPTEDIIKLYRSQAIHEPTCLNSKDPRKIPVFIADAVEERWKRSVETATSSIRTAAPGINIFIVDRKRDAKILIDEADERNTYTVGDIWIDGWAKIYLYNDHDYARNLVVRKSSREKDEDMMMLATCTHELLHALGYDHEYQCGCSSRRRGNASRVSNSEEYLPLHAIVNLAQYNPDSIMLYPGLPEKGVPVSHKVTMSELDKITLNLIYPPRKHFAYSPKKFQLKSTNILFYCFRNVLGFHNLPYDAISNGICGGDPSNPKGPNCPACRTLNCCENCFLKTYPIRWQGWSGMFYCEKLECGPNAGIPCKECNAVLDLP